jgi:hypothetical protein
MEPQGVKPRQQKQMALLAEYIKAVRTYLPKGAEGNDIANELTELLQSKFDEREEVLGRPLTETEQEVLLAEFGNPLVVAARYGRVTQGLAFGRQLIGPELFPIYLRALAIPFAIDLIFAPFLMFSQRPVFTNPLQILIPLFLQVVLMTVIFMGFHTARAWSRKGPAAEPRDALLFPRAYLRPTPRWLSAMGLIIQALVALWWVAVPRAPHLVIGDFAAVVRLAPAWSQFFWPILALLLANVAHRAASLIRPDWNWLRPTAVVAVNMLALALLYPMLRAEPYFELSATAGTNLGVQALMHTLNDYFWWYLVGFGSYWLINVYVCARVCSQLLNHRLHREHH